MSFADSPPHVIPGFYIGTGDLNSFLFGYLASISPAESSLKLIYTIFLTVIIFNQIFHKAGVYQQNTHHMSMNKAQ